MRRALLAIVLIASFVGVTAAPAYAPDSCNWRNGARLNFGSTRNGGLVAAELSWTGSAYGQLRARTSVSVGAGPWETFELVCVTAPNVYALRSVPGRGYVSAEISWTGDRYGLLRARATSIGPWERFRIEDRTGGLTLFSLANNRYVTTEVGRSGELRARATSVGAWEIYNLWGVTGY